MEIPTTNWIVASETNKVTFQLFADAVRLNDITLLQSDVMKYSLEGIAT